MALQWLCRWPNAEMLSNSAMNGAFFETYVIRDQIYPIEIKAGILPVHAAKNFSMLDKYKMKIETGLITCNTDKIRPINEKVYQVPVYLLP